jgi:amidohydrolase
MFANEIQAVLESSKVQLREVSNEIFSFAETGHNEFKSSKLLVDFLQENDFAVEYPYGGLRTAFRADYGNGKPVFCVMCEYDALPEIGHACGHHLIAAAAVGAGIAIKEIMKKHSLAGTVTVLGTPAEETFGGKIDLMKAGAFEGIDAAVLCHPYNKTGIDPGDLAVSRFDVEFIGRASHAASAPDKGINALDAINLLFAGINAWRQHLPDSSRVHGIISKGGDAANIIPAHTAGYFYLRSVTNEGCAEMEKRFRDIVKGAALMTGCGFECKIRPNSYMANLPYPFMDEFVKNRLEKNGMNPEYIPDCISTDYGNVSQIIPACNFFFSIIEDNRETGLHSMDFKESASKDYAFEQTLKAGKVMAETGIEYLQCRLRPSE